MSETKLTYGRYLEVPALLSLQTCQSQPEEHDEPLFIIIHQVYELWFKLVLHEIDAALTHLGADRIEEGTRLLRRVVEIQRLLIHQIRVLETMRPQDFLLFRYNLNPASGFQSVQFRELEFVLGQKHPKVLEHIECDAAERERLMRRLEAPSVSDVLDAAMVRNGVMGEGPDARVIALRRIYENPAEFPALAALCEVLIEMDECLALWRFHHVQMVERMIGRKRGTGGSDGVGYLQSTLSKRAFPDLWHVRTWLGQDAPEPGA